MMMAKKSVPILKQIADNDDIDQQHRQQEGGEFSRPAHFINLDRNKKSRLANRHPAGPTDPKDHSDPFNERKQAVEQSAGCRPEHIGFSQLPHLLGDMSKEFVARMNTQRMQNGLNDRLAQ